MATRVLLADDQRLVRAGMRLILGPEKDIEVVGEAADGLEAVQLAQSLAPDVVIMDVRMPRMDGIEATRRVVALSEPPAVLVVTTFDLDEYVYAALKAGASGFLLKDASEEQMVQAIRTVRSGVSLLSPEVTRRLVEARVLPMPQHSVRLDRLTPREAEVLRLMGRGLSNREIADHFVLTEATVKTHVGRVLAKLDLSSRAQAVVLAYEAGVVSVGERD
jgi:DNA-binding NarL/FixJ family response regulator